MPPASTISWDQDDWRRESSEGSNNPSYAFKLTKVNLTPPGPEIALPWLSRATASCEDVGRTWPVGISPEARVRCGRMESERGSKCRDLA